MGQTDLDLSVMVDEQEGTMTITGTHGIPHLRWGSSMACHLREDCEKLELGQSGNPNPNSNWGTEAYEFVSHGADMSCDLDERDKVQCFLLAQ